MRHFQTILALTALLLLSGCAMSRFSDENASGYRQMEREQCVPYARRVSGIDLRGDAWTWWNAAAGKYQRGQRPEPGAMLVLAKTKRLRSGHLAVVKDIIGPREINVTHTNWGDDFMSRRIVYESMRAQDVSANNDWTSVRFWNREHDVLGAPYLAHGFIYNRPETSHVVMPAYPAQPVIVQTIMENTAREPAPVPVRTLPRPPLQMRPIVE